MPGLDDFVGQSALKELLRPKIQIAAATGTALPHLLLCGDDAQGKMTFVTRISEESGVPFASISAHEIEKRLDLTGALANVRARQILAIREVDALRAPIIDLLVEAISTYGVKIPLASKERGFWERVMPLPRFTFVGTASKPWLVHEHIRRWCIPCQFAPYTEDQVAQVALRIAEVKMLPLELDAASEIAVQCKLKLGEVEVFLQKVANHFSFRPTDRVDRVVLRKLNEFLGAGNVYPEILTVASQTQKMGGLEFEHWVADLFRRVGFTVEVTQASGDHGVDLWVSKDASLIAVQCKRWDGPVGEPVVRDLYGAMISAEARVGCIVTTGSFTGQAHQFAKGKQIRLIGFDVLMELVRSPESLLRVVSG